MNHWEEAVTRAVEGVKLGVETLGVAVIALGVLSAIFSFIRALVGKGPHDFNDVRLILARYLALGLEFQLAADILSTAIAPDWNQIGKLAAIAVIRTVLNFFLMHEMREERRRDASEVGRVDEGDGAISQV